MCGFFCLGFGGGSRFFEHVRAVGDAIFTDHIALDEVRVVDDHRNAGIEAELVKEFTAVCSGHSKDPRFTPACREPPGALRGELAEFDAEAIHIVQYN